MKKWIFLYVLAGTALFVGILRYQSGRELAEAEIVYQEPSCWIANEIEGSYLLLGGEQGNQWRAVRTDGGKKNYHLLGATSLDQVYYYQYCYQKETQHWVYGVAGRKQEGELTLPELEQAEQGHSLAFGGREGRLYWLLAEEDGRLVREYSLAVAGEDAGEVPEWRETQQIEPPEGHKAVGASYQEGALSLCLENGEVYRYGEGTVALSEEEPESIVSSPKTAAPEEARKALKKAIASAKGRSLVLPYLVLLVFFLLVLCGILWNGSPIRRIFYMAVGVLAVVVLAGGSLAGIRIRQELQKEALSQASYTLLRTWEKTEGTAGLPDRIDLLTTLEASNGKLLEVLLLDTSVIPAEIAAAPWLPERLTASACYGEELERLAARARQRTSTVTGELDLSGCRNQVVLLPETGRREGYVLVGILSERELAGRLAEQLHTLAWTMGILFVGGLVILLLAFLFWGTAWNRFSRAVMAVAREKEGYRLPDKAPAGLQGLWRSLAEINRSMGEIHYEKYQSLKAYSRFVPRKIEYILGKKGLDEVAAGDMAEVSGVMALLSLRSLEEPDGRRYMDLVTKSFQLMNRVLEEKRGILISQNADLAKRKLLFLERPESAVEFGIETIHAYDRDPLLSRAETLVLLHASRFLYGISGTEEQAVPFLYSRDEAFLTPYIEPLCRAGLRLVLTEDLVEQLRSSYAFRYIGFVVKGDTGESMKLYEGLDTLPEAKRKLWLETEPEFRRALELFYSNDFYLARNTFNEVVKKNPEDRIARWYLFNCEYHLNTAGDTEVAYGLFENRMLEQQYRSKLEVF